MTNTTEHLKDLVNILKSQSEAEAENNAFKLLVKSLLSDLKQSGWEDDYNTFMLQTMTDNSIVNDEIPTIAEAYAISSLYASKLEGLCIDLTKLIDSNSSQILALTQTMLAIYNDSYKSIMATRPPAPNTDTEDSE